MAALTQDRPTPEREGRLVSDPLAASLISASAYILMALVLLLRPLGLVGRR